MKSVNSSLKSPWLSDFSGHRARAEGFVCGPLRPSQLLGLPAQPGPLADVIGQASPHRFHPDLGQTAQAELTQTELVLDPGIGSLGDPGALYEIDYDFCKGCGLCVAECPSGAIEMVPEET